MIQSNANVSRETSQSLVTVDQTTGEVILSPQEDMPVEGVIASRAMAEKMEPFRQGSQLPVHIAMLERAEFTDEQKEALVSLYMGELLTFDDVVNRELTCLGMIVYQHPAFNGRDGQYHPEGYYQSRFLVELDGSHKVVASGSAPLAIVVSYMLQRRGWWLFPEPLKFRFSKDKNKVHHVQNMVPLRSDVLRVRKEK